MDISNYYKEKGRGEDLILLHGNGESSDYFSEQISFFSEYYHVTAPDTRGHGKTPRGSAPFDLKQFASDLKFFMDEHDISRTHLLGFSDGGNIALYFVLRYTERVNKLILNGANTVPEGVRRIYQLPVEYRFRKLAKRKDLSENEKKELELLGLMVNEPDITSEDLHSVRNETLVIAGTHDMIKRSHTKYIAENIKNSEIVFIKGDHFIAEKNSDDFNHAVLRFLQKTE